MKFTKVNEPSRRAEKVSGTGAVYYFTWHDQNGDEYVQVDKVVGGRGLGNGSFSKDLYHFESLGEVNHIEGFDPNTTLLKVSNDLNMPGFLKAIKADVLLRRAASRKNEI